MNELALGVSRGGVRGLTQRHRGLFTGPQHPPPDVRGVETAVLLAYIVVEGGERKSRADQSCNAYNKLYRFYTAAAKRDDGHVWLPMQQKTASDRRHARPVHVPPASLAARLLAQH